MKTYLLCLFLSIIFTILAGFLVIPLLKRLKIGQPILKYVKIHKGKSGTATMGGLFFIPVSIIVFLFFSKGKNYLAILTLSITLAFMLVGFIDDFLKIKFHKNEGLTPLQKILFQLSISIIASYFAYESGVNFFYLPFTNKSISVGVLSIPINVLIFVATVNSVNLTDGLDGLCASVSAVVLTAIPIIILLQMNGDFISYIVSEEYKNLSLLCFSTVGALLGYLFFNTHKASVFMGDSGSLALGGIVSSACIFTGNALLIAVIGICYLVTSLSVIIQVIYYKKTGKRVFLMSPLHHHFQEKGYSEAKISYAYSLITAIISIILIFSYC